MIDYRTPLADIVFALEQAVGDRALPGWDAEVARSVLEHAARFVDGVIAPLDLVSDREGARLEAGRVRLPAAFGAAYQAYCAGGWPGLAAGEDYGGQGLSGMIAGAFSEMLAGACHGLHMSLSLPQGAMRTLRANASPAQQARWMPRLAGGEWLATMCLTEPQAGSDLSLVRTLARPDGKGWRIEGSKIFVSGGDQDLTGKTLHFVLARTPEAQPGLKGLSLFLAPSEHDDGRRNGIEVLRIEEKMGLHGSPTCQLAFNGAEAEMVGAPGEGLKRMFALMNAQRVDVGLQGVGLATAAMQRTLAYVNGRRQGRGIGGTALLVEHDDVRRMLLTQMALVGGGRTLCYRLLADIEAGSESPLIDMMTSVCKFFCTEAAISAAQLAIQCHGGYGYLAEYRVEQVLRDSRITAIYEGTNGIHAMTLASRVIHVDGVAEGFTADAMAAGAVAAGAGLVDTARILADLTARWNEATAAVRANPRVGGVADAYMRLTAMVAFAAAWARLEAAAGQAPNPERLRATARFVREFMLVEAGAYAAICAGSTDLGYAANALRETL